MKCVVSLAAVACAAVLSCTSAQAGPTEKTSSKDKEFFESVKGEWVGPGEIVAGKYKGTKFTCTLTGTTPEKAVGMALDGGCRVGMFTQKMSAKVERRGKSYAGSFLDGAVGKGLDIIGGNVTERKVVFSLNRAALSGAMLARLPDDNTMHVTVSVRVEKEMVPVIGMKLTRVDGGAVGPMAQK